jgi:hypothetical protein
MQAMTPRISDTSPEAERVQTTGLCSLPIWQKFELVSELIMNVRQLAFTGLQERFPDAPAEELRRRLATLCLGRELAEKVYGPEPNPPTLP